MIIKIRFFLHHNDESIRTLDQLRIYCNINQLLIDYRDQDKLKRWLDALRDYDSLIEAIDKISSQNDLEVAKELVEILGIETQILEDYQQKIDNSRKFFDCGNAYYELQEYENALADYNQAIELDPNYTEAINRRDTTINIIAEIKKAEEKAKRESEIQNFTEELPNGINLEMIAIPAGEFMMGSNEYDDEKPVHKVILKEFYMSKFLVTQAQYQAIMGKNPSRFQNAEKAPLSKGGWGDHPVESVSWNDAQEFCQKLSQITGKEYKLPSEAQWEYACRAGSTGKWCFGDDESQLGEYAWYGDNSGESKLDTVKLWQTDSSSYSDKLRANKCQTHPVGQKKPNQWGLYDMHGNVWEWCEDNYVNSYQNTPTDGSSYINQNLEYVVLRGGFLVRQSLLLPFCPPHLQLRARRHQQQQRFSCYLRVRENSITLFSFPLLPFILFFT